MLANALRNVLLFLLPTIFVGSIVVIVGGTIWTIRKARENNSPNRKKMVVISILAIFIAAVSWIFNMGWIRFFMTFMLLPFIHAIIFFLTSLFMALYADKSKSIRILHLVFCITYLLSYIFFPDGGDYGGLYFFFGLIHNDFLANIAYGIAGVAFAGHVVLFVLQIMQAVRVRKRQADSHI